MGAKRYEALQRRTGAEWAPGFRETWQSRTPLARVHRQLHSCRGPLSPSIEAPECAFHPLFGPSIRPLGIRIDSSCTSISLCIVPASHLARS